MIQERKNCIADALAGRWCSEKRVDRVFLVRQTAFAACVCVSGIGKPVQRLIVFAVYVLWPEMWMAEARVGESKEGRKEMEREYI